MELEGYIACICEGSAEQAIMDLLLDNNKLIFSKEQMLEGETIRCRGAKNFEFVKNYFKDIDGLVKAIYEHKRLAKIPKGEKSLCDLLK